MRRQAGLDTSKSGGPGFSWSLAHVLRTGRQFRSPQESHKPPNFARPRLLEEHERDRVHQGGRGNHHGDR